MGYRIRIAAIACALFASACQTVSGPLDDADIIPIKEPLVFGTGSIHGAIFKESTDGTVSIGANYGYTETFVKARIDVDVDTSSNTVRTRAEFLESNSDKYNVKLKSSDEKFLAMVKRLKGTNLEQTFNTRTGAYFGQLQDQKTEENLYKISGFIKNESGVPKIKIFMEDNYYAGGKSLEELKRSMTYNVREFLPKEETYENIEIAKGKIYGTGNYNGRDVIIIKIDEKVLNDGKIIGKNNDILLHAKHNFFINGIEYYDTKTGINIFRDIYIKGLGRLGKYVKLRITHSINLSDAELGS